MKRLCIILIGILAILPYDAQVSQAATLATGFTCPEEPQEEFNISKPDKEKTERVKASLDDATHELTRKHQEFKKTKGKRALRELYTLLKGRKKSLIEMMRHDPETALAAVLPEPERSGLRALTENCVEAVETVEGTLAVMVADDFAQAASRERYTLITTERRLILHPVGRPTELLESRTRIRVQGVRLDSDLAFDAGASLEVLSQPGNPPVLGEQRTVVILARFQNAGSASPTVTEVSDFLATQVAPFYAENSYTKIGVTGDVHGWYNLPINASCDAENIVVPEAIRAADNEIYFPNYSRLIVIAPFRAAGCSWAGIASIGKTFLNTNDGPVTMSWTAIYDLYGTNLPVVAHELGHNFGNHHAEFLDCGDATIAASGCTEVAYGDFFDVMGASGAFHFNAPHKEVVGWFEPTNLLTVTASGTYVLEPIEPASPGLKAIKLQRSTSDYLYLEYRQPIGFDLLTSPSSDGYEGALVHSLLSPNRTALLDPTPLDDTRTIALRAGLSLTDPATGTQVTTVSASPTALTLDVVLGRTDFTPPTTLITAPSTGVTVTGALTVTASASDASGIERVEFYYRVGLTPEVLFATDAEPPYEGLLDTTHIRNGTLNLRARAYDLAGAPFGAVGNSAFSPTVQVTVANTDPNPPSAMWVAPQEGSAVMGPVTATASASDDVGIWKVEFYRNGKLTGTDSVSPFGVTWTLPVGAYTAYAKAYDFVGNTASTNPPVSFTVVPDTIAPTVAITNPVEGAYVRGVLVVTADASDNVGVTQVDFYLDGSATPFFTSTTAPFKTGFLITSSLPDGPHTFQATAYDAAGNSAPSIPVSVTIDNTLPSAPTGLVVTRISSGAVTLSWTQSPESDIVSYTLSYGTQSGAYSSTKSVPQTTTSDTISGLANGTRYYFTVRAIDHANNNSGYSNEVSAVPRRLKYIRPVLE